MYCSESLALTSRVLSLTLWLLGAISHLTVLLLTVRIYKNYHLFFIISYMAMLLTRVLSASIKTSGYLLVLTRNDGVPESINDALWAAKLAMQAAALSCIIERGYATLYATVYEKSKKCSSLVICIVVLVFCAILTVTESISDIGRKVDAVSYGCFLALTASSLMVINRKLVAKSAIKCDNLSERYQLKENVKALRLLLPFVIATALNAILLSIGIVFFDVDTVFDLPKCHSFPHYLPVFYIILIQTTFLNAAAPLYVIYTNRNTLRRRKTGVAERLGVNLVSTEQQNEHYFQQLQSQWA